MLHARRPARELARTRDDVHDGDEQARADEHKRPHYPVGRGHLRLNTLIALQEAGMLVCAFHLFVRAHEGLFAS